MGFNSGFKGLNLVPKLFDHATELYCQHYRVPYCLNLQYELCTVSSSEILALQPISAHQNNWKVGYISVCCVLFDSI